MNEALPSAEAAVPAEAAEAADAAPSSPYVGLVPYSEDDAAFFFGREQECSIISANLIAYPLTLLYGPSGVGKSSVLRAGVAHSLRRQANEDLGDDGKPGSVVVVFSTWRDDPVQGILAAVDGELRRLGLEPDGGTAARSAAGLMDGLRAAGDRLEGSLLIILDQFEEYFLYHGLEDGPGTFAAEFPRIVDSRDMRVHFLAAIREDALARLDRFKGQMRNPFANRLSIDHLKRAAAREAIEGPLGEYNARLGTGGRRVRVEPELVDAVLDQVQTGQVVLGQAGRGTVTPGGDGAAAGGRIETPFLQLVMTRLWDDEMRGGSAALRLETLERLGGAQRIVRTHLDTAMEALPASERDVAASVFHYLVTPSGTKIAHSTADLAEYASRAEEILVPVMEQLSAGGVRILRPVAPPADEQGPARYEIFHDVLAPAILDWRTRYLREREREREERARTERGRARRFGALAVASLVLAAAVGGLAWWAVGQKTAAREESRLAQLQTRIALSESQIAAASSTAARDPAGAVGVALGSLRRAATPEAELLLREALPNSHLRAVLDPGIGTLRLVRFSPDGQYVVAAGRSGAIAVWDAASGGLLHVLPGHAGRIEDIEFSNAGTLLVSASQDKTARIWDVRSGKQLHELGGFAHPVLEASFSHDDTEVVTASQGDGAWVWDANTGLLIEKLRGRYNFLNCAAFSPDGTTVATGSGEGYVTIFDLATGRPEFAPLGVVDKSVTRNRPYVVHVAFSPKGDLVAAANSNGTVNAWNAVDGASLSSRCCFSGVTNAVGFSPDGQWILAGGGKTAEAFLAKSNSFHALMTGHTDWVNDATYSADGTYVVTASSDGTARVWSADSGTLLFILGGHSDAVLDARFSPDGKTVATAGEDGTVRLWDVQTGSWAFVGTRFMQDADWNATRSRVVVGGVDGAYVVDVSSGHRSPLYQYERVNAVSFKPDGTQVLVAGSYGTVDLFDPADGKWVESCCHVSGYDTITEASYSPDGSTIVTVIDGSAKLWGSGGSHEAIATISEEDASIVHAEMSSTGRLLTIDSEHRAVIWDVQTKVPITSPVGHVYRVASFSPDGRHLVTDGLQRTLRVWQLTDGDQLEQVSTLRGSLTNPTAAAITDGEEVAAGTGDGTTLVWNGANGSLLAELRLQSDYINSIRLTPDGTTMLAASDDYTAKIFDCQTCGSLGQVEQQAATYLRALAAHGYVQPQSEPAYSPPS